MLHFWNEALYEFDTTHQSSLFWLLSTFELPLVRGDYAIGGCVLKLCLLWHAIIIIFSFNKDQAWEQHLQVTSNINTLSEPPQIYPHLYETLKIQRKHLIPRKKSQRSLVSTTRSYAESHVEKHQMHVFQSHERKNLRYNYMFKLLI